MKCPYAVTRSTTSQTVYEYGEDGEMTMQQTVDHNEAKFVDCLEGNCAAWQKWPLPVQRRMTIFC